MTNGWRKLEGCDAGLSLFASVQSRSTHEDDVNCYKIPYMFHIHFPVYVFFSCIYIFLSNTKEVKLNIISLILCLQLLISKSEIR